MNKHMLYISISLFSAAVICFILMYVILKMGNYSKAKNKESCDKESETQTKQDAKKCAVWNGSQCRKGQTVAGIFCLAQPNITPLILMITGVLFFIASIITFIITFVLSRKKPKND